MRDFVVRYVVSTERGNSIYFEKRGRLRQQAKSAPHLVNSFAQKGLEGACRFPFKKVNIVAMWM